MRPVIEVSVCGGAESICQGNGRHGGRGTLKDSFVALQSWTRITAGGVPGPIESRSSKNRPRGRLSQRLLS